MEDGFIAHGYIAFGVFRTIFRKLELKNVNFFSPESGPENSKRTIGEKDTKLTQKLGQLQFFIPASPQKCMGQLAYFWLTQHLSRY